MFSSVSFLTNKYQTPSFDSSTISSTNSGEVQKIVLVIKNYGVFVENACCGEYFHKCAINFPQHCLVGSNRKIFYLQP